MATLNELPVIDAPDQIFTCSLNGKRCQFRLIYNDTIDRWSFWLWISDELKLVGRRIVAGADLVGAFSFGIGRIVCAPWSEDGLLPNRENLPSGRVRLFQIQE